MLGTKLTIRTLLGHAAGTSPGGDGSSVRKGAFMITVSLTNLPQFQSSLCSPDVRDLCIRAENAMRAWGVRGLALTVTVEGGSAVQREHIRRYLEGVRDELAAIPLGAREAPHRRPEPGGG